MADVATNLRLKIAAGVLPLPTEPPGKVWVGKGTALSCDACDGSIPATELEYEVDVAKGPSLRFHSKCLTAWQHERACA
jgi:hypothetical protein